MGFRNLKGKKPFGAGSYINDEGLFKVKINAVKEKQSESDAGKFFLIVEFKVMESSIESVAVDSTKSQTININNNAGASDAVAFMAAAAGLDPYSAGDDFESEVIAAYEKALEVDGLDLEGIADALVDDAQPLEGLELILETVNKPLKHCKNMSPSDPDYKVFTKHMWTPVD